MFYIKERHDYLCSTDRPVFCPTLHKAPCPFPDCVAVEFSTREFAEAIAADLNAKWNRALRVAEEVNGKEVIPTPEPLPKYKVYAGSSSFPDCTFQCELEGHFEDVKKTVGDLNPGVSFWLVNSETGRPTFIVPLKVS